MAKTVTLSDIAKVCGTSTVTVSKALAEKSGVSEELRRKIKLTAEQLGYSYSKAASVKVSNMIGVIIPEAFMNPNGSFYWALYNGLVKELKEKGYFCVMELISLDDESSLKLPKIITENTVSALISLGQVSNDYALLLKKNITNLLLLDYYVPGIGIDSVTTDGYAGGYMLASHLIKLGHKDIGYIGSVKATSSIFDRYMGYMKAMIDNDLSVIDKWTLDDRVKNSFIDIAFPDNLPTAFVCNCDEAASHAIRQLEKMGLRVPEDISVVGYDNYLISELSKPTITTINVDSQLMAQKAVEMLTERIASPDMPARDIKICGELIIKDSARMIG